MGLGSKKKVVLYLYFGLLALALIPFMGVLFKLSNVLSEAFVGMGQPGFVVILAIIDVYKRQGPPTFKERVMKDPDFLKLCSKEEIESCFDLADTLSHVEYIFRKAGLLQK